MPMTDIEATKGATITLRSDGCETTVELYSQEGVNLLNSLRLKQAAEFKLMYEPRWLGQQVSQLPEDIVAMQELIWQVRPDVLVECGVAHGGSLILYASVFELIGKGKVVGVDVEIKPHNRQAIEAHTLAHRISLIEGSSTAPETFEAVRRQCHDAQSSMVVLDSNHSAKHVAQELRLYEMLVTPGSYLVVMDGAQGLVSDIPRGKADWKEDNPLPAIRQFLASRPDFERDIHLERFGATSVPEGFLKRVGAAPSG